PEADGENDSSKRFQNESSYFKESEDWHPVKVLPSELNSTDVIEKMRNSKRPEEERAEIHVDSTGDVSSKDPPVQKEESSQIRKKKNNLAKSINRTISKGKNSLRLGKHKELLDDSSSVSSSVEYDLTRTNDGPIDDLKRTTVEAVEDELSGHSSRTSSPRSIDGLPEGDRRSSTSDSMSYSSCSRSICSKEGCRRDSAELDEKIEKKTKMSPKKFWSFTTNVIFPK
ncbi:hypothetical protein FHG87_001284, partial [Trinorchestia longiramus]